MTHVIKKKDIHISLVIIPNGHKALYMLRKRGS